MKVKPRRKRAEAEFDQLITDFKPLARRTLSAIVVSRFVLALIPLQLKYLLDPLLQSRTVTIGSFTIDPVLVLICLVASGLLIAAVRGIADYVTVATAGLHGHQLVAGLRVLMYEHILRVPSSYALNRGTGKILLRFIGDSDALRSWYSRKEPEVKVDRFLVALLLVVMLVVDWRLSLVVLIPLPFVILVARRLAPKLADETLQARFKQAGLSGAIGHRFDNIHQAKWLDRYRDNRQEIVDMTELVARLNAQRDVKAAMLQGLGQCFAFTSVPLLLLAGVLLAWQQVIELGQCIAFVWLTAHLAITIHRLNAAIVIREKAYVSRDRIFRLLERSAERGRSSHLTIFEPRGESLQLESVELAGSGRNSPALSFEIDQPGIHSIDNRQYQILVRALLGLDKLKAGRIRIDGEDLATLNIESVRQAIGWVNGSPMIVPGTVRDNLQLAAPHLSESEIESLCQQWTDRDVSWLDEETGMDGQLLSFEERHDVSLLRAVINQPPFYLVDAELADLRTIHMLEEAEFQNQKPIIIVASAKPDLHSDSAFADSSSARTSDQLDD